jgi:hypothetical protein
MIRVACRIINVIGSSTFPALLHHDHHAAGRLWRPVVDRRRRAGCRLLLLAATA